MSADRVEIFVDCAPGLAGQAVEIGLSFVREFSDRVGPTNGVAYRTTEGAWLYAYRTQGGVITVRQKT